MAKAPKFLTAHWTHLAMLNYEVDPSILRKLLPTSTDLDTFDGKTFLSMVSFQFLDTRVLGVPVPFHRDFDEVNLRFYVRRNAEDGPRRGVVFIKEIVPRTAIAWVGLWEEPWSEYFARLAKSVQPYAHCSPELIQWNLAALTEASSGQFVAGTGLYDATKASRLTLFHILAGWTLGRILIANRPPPEPLVDPSAIDALGRALADSEFLIRGEDWSAQLWPHMFFKR